jgi:myo-inositol-1(or 4)-monophosphatase
MTTKLSRLEIAIKAVVDAGNLLVSHYGKISKLKQKESLRDVVTDIDKLSETAILNVLNKNDPEFGVLTEESGFVGLETEDFWVVDALDGTVNYIHQVPLFSVSVSFFQGGKPVVGAVYNPLAKDLYYSELGKGCFKNQKQLTIEDTPITKNLMSMAFSGKLYKPEERHKEFELFGKLNDNSQGCLRTGSAAINLAYVSDGHFGAAIGKASKLWDIAAGLVLAESAGAKVNFKIINKERYLVDYIVATPSCYAGILETVKPSYLELE